MTSYIGLTLEEALKDAESNGIKTVVKHYASKRGVADKDRDIVVRALDKDGVTELVVCGFKTDV